jgi:RHS repeat-associated protein
MYFSIAGTKPAPNCLPQFGGGSIESRDGESFEGVGETRLTTGTIFTDKLFTGQREMAGLGIYHYGARFYSPKLGRFLSADTIVPGAANPQAYNRYSYVLGNPLKYIDLSRHGQTAVSVDVSFLLPWHWFGDE